MRIRVSLVPSEEFNAGTAEVAFVNVECGSGEQILRWLGHEAVRRMEHLASIPTSTPSLVPQAVSDATGIVLDPDTVLKEVAKDGDAVIVRFGRGSRGVHHEVEGPAEASTVRVGSHGLEGRDDPARA